MIRIAAVVGAAALLAQGPVRTADPLKRGLKESDFPRVIKLADQVFAYEDLRSAGDEKFTTTNLFVVTSEGVLVADGQGNAAATKGLVEAIHKITPQPIKYVVICSDHGDHTAGNASFPAGVTYIVHPTSKATLEAQASAAAGRGNAAPGWALPATADVVADRKVLRLGGEEIQILFLGRAHTGGDLNVYLPNERILFMSEAFLNRVFPAMRSAYPTDWMAVLRRAEAMAVDRYVPGHGFTEEPKVSREELVSYRNAVAAVIAEARRLHDAGVPVEEAVKQAKFGEYDGWTIARQQGPIAIRKVYDELDGKLK
jgi:glyoxylase-like metal-dependent hydrolase (beta-lactamase superfamily II)